MRLRIRYTKEGKVRFLGHRDVARVWERALRRAGFDLAYSQGFSPRPKLHFGLALPTSYESDVEYLDVDLRTPVEVDEPLLDRLTEVLPDGMDVVLAVETSRAVDSLQSGVERVDWAALVEGRHEDALREGIRAALAAECLPYTRMRKGKEVDDDFRPYLLSAEVIGDRHRRIDHPAPAPSGAINNQPSRDVEFHCGLVARPRAPRPTEFLRAMGLGFEPVLVRRLAQTTSVGGAPEQVLGSDPTRRDCQHDRRTSRRIGHEADAELKRT